MELDLKDGMCRCCASEGSYKDFTASYQWMGVEEVYSDMLKDCFDITLSTSNMNNGGICEVCITQLRNAFNFKKQVLNTEEQFKKLQENLLNSDIVKIEEVQADVDDTFEADDMDADFSGSEYDLPIKLIKKEKYEESKPKKRTRASTSKSKKNSEESGETSAKRDATTSDNEIELNDNTSSSIFEPVINMKIDELAASHSDDEDSKPLKHLQIDYDDKLEEEIPGNQCVSVFVDLSTRRSRAASAKEMKQHLVNIRTILLNTNATPIRYHDGTAYICAVCPEQYPTVLDLKNHVLEEHDNVDKATFLEKSRLTTYVAKLDITDLQCNICRQKIDSNLTSLLHHLKDVHQKPMHLDIPNHILPFKFNGKDFDCVECTKTYEHFKLIQEHMSSHYRNYVCDICDAPFVNKRNMQSHRIRHKKGEFPCSHCSKIFETKRKKLDHEKFVHGGDWKRNKCPHCQAKFTNYNNKRAHMVKEHGAEPPLIKCFVCDKIFSTRAALSLHKKENTH